MAAEPPQPRPQPPQRLLSNSTKRSLRSHSSSFEADDERSSSGDQESMGPEPDAGVHIRPQYPGEDTRLTSRKELAGWYAYGFAAEVFIICGMGELRNFLSIWTCSSSNHRMLTILSGRILHSYHTRTIGSRKRSIII